MSKIILTTLNAKYIHSSLGLRYLLANMQELQPETQIREFTIDARPIDLAEKLLNDQPTIIGFGIYIWNREQSLQVINLIKAIAPNTVIVIGGPEVSYECEQALCRVADYTITGPADLSFYQLCKNIFAKRAPIENIIKGAQPALSDLASPYNYYTDEDIKNRIIYVEASRGCPFKCEFCLSSLDKTAWPFALDNFLNDMENLYQRGVRHFKFVDRTFNLKIKSTLRILAFFLDKNDPALFLHFELIPDHLPEALKDMIAKFPPGSLQFEVGIQSFTTEVQTLISRRQNNEKSKANLKWLREHSHAHIHTDLIFGLPGETLASFASSFDQLVALNPHEVQLGILKRLKGSPIVRHTEDYAMIYNTEPPFNILANKHCDFATVQRVNRFARYWDMLANSGRFKHTLPYLLADAPFQRFLAFSDWLYADTDQTHKISLLRLFDLLARGLQQVHNVAAETFLPALCEDYKNAGLKSLPECLKPFAGQFQKTKPKVKNSLMSRQARHLFQAAGKTNPREH